MGELLTARQLAEGEQTAKYMRQMIEVGKPLVESSRLATEEAPQREDIAVMFQVLEAMAPYANPLLLPSWWEHTYEAGFQAELLGDALVSCGQNLDVPKFTIDMINHDWGRLAIPNRYYRNDTMRRLLLRKLGFDEQYWNDPVNIEPILSGTIQFDTLTAQDRAAIVIDNLAKRNPQGEQFTLPLFYRYLDEQAMRYPNTDNILWPSERWGTQRMKAGEVVSRHIVAQSYEWIESLGISYSDIQAKTQQKIPVILYIFRHGDTNHNGLVYNWDEFNTRQVGLTEKGFEQMDVLAEIIVKNRISVNAIHASDIYRARLSAETILKGLAARGASSTTYINYDAALRDTRAELVTSRWTTMAEFQSETGGNVYTPELLDAGVESLAHVQQRWGSAVDSIRTHRAANGSAHIVVVGHGDPIRTYIAKLEEPQRRLTYEDFPELLQTDYLNKGEGWRIIFSPQGRYLSKTRLPV